MKRLTLTLTVFLYSLHLLANGVGIVDAAQQQYLTLLSSAVHVRIQDQVAITTTTQVFRNDLGGPRTFKYGFPTPKGATAVGLRWQLDGVWHEASFNAGAMVPDLDREMGLFRRTRSLTVDCVGAKGARVRAH